LAGNRRTSDQPRETVCPLIAGRGRGWCFFSFELRGEAGKARGEGSALVAGAGRIGGSRKASGRAGTVAMMKPKTNNRIAAIVCALLAGVVLVGVGGLLYSGIRAGRIEVARLPRGGWGFGAQRFYWLFVGDKVPRGESTVYRLGVFCVTVRKHCPAGFDPQRHGAVKIP
jgi:hypothetical protein